MGCFPTPGLSHVLFSEIEKTGEKTIRRKRASFSGSAIEPALRANDWGI
jgi:hypothetical protein